VEHAVEAVASLPTIAECSDARGLQAIEAPVDPAMAKAVEAEGPALAEVEAWVATGQFARAKAAIGSRVEAAVGLGHGPLLAEAQLLAARVETGTGDFVAARKAAYESLWAAQAARDDTGVARAWLALQGIAGQRGRWDEASHLGRHGEAAVSRLGMPKELEATLRNGLGVIYEQRGEYERARTELSRALELRRELYGEEHHEVARVLTNLGNLARSEGRKEALDFHRQALAIDLVVLGQGHPTVGRHHHNVARVLLLSGDAAGALENYEMALAIRTAAHGPKHVDVGRTHNSLGLLFARLDDPERATTHYRRALEIFEAGEHADQGLVLHNLGLLDARAGRHADAVEQQRRAREVLSRHVQGSSRPLVAAVLAMAEARVALGQTKAAAEDYASAEALATTLGDEALIARARQGAERLGDAAILVEPPKPEPTKPPKRRRKKRRDQGLEEPQGSYAAGRAFDGP
ncbi:MAG: tetratricopeptide repeat protein, partial [Myxococcota bacterium]